MLDQGLPKEWQRLINESGISEKERRENPQTMVDILQFYKETTERPPEDQSLEKFHNAATADSRQYGVAPTSPNTYPSNYFGMALFLSHGFLCSNGSSLSRSQPAFLTTSLSSQEALRIPARHLLSLPVVEPMVPARSRRSCRVDRRRNLQSA
jgi:hypothetical protein